MIINSPKNISIYRNNSGESVTPLVSTLDVREISYKRDGYPDIASLGDAITLLQKDYPLSDYWKKFTENGTFVVPEGVEEILVMVIAAGRSSDTTDNNGSMLVSRYFDVTPGSKATVTVGKSNALGASNSSVVSRFQISASLNVGASVLGTYAVDATSNNRQYVTGQDPAFPTALASKKMGTIGRLSDRIAPSGTDAGPGAGGYAVPLDVPDERLEWLKVARDMPPGTMNNGQLCWPDSTQKGGDAEGTKAGAGGGYGGAAGKYATGAAVTENGALGGPGLVCVFWGPDIHKVESTEPSE